MMHILVSVDLVSLTHTFCLIALTFVYKNYICVRGVLQCQYFFKDCVRHHVLYLEKKVSCFFFFQVFEGVYNNSRMLHFLTAVVVSFLLFASQKLV